MPFVVVEIGNNGRGLGRQLHGEAKRVGLELSIAAVSRFDRVLIGGAGAFIRQKDFPYAARALAHWIAASIPTIEVADDADNQSIGSPDNKACSAYAFQNFDMCAESVIALEIRAL